jgi:undecaprenyl phosphate-alpha-L-ara4FN deformylase
MRRTSALRTYGWKTVLYGTLLPGPQIARSHAHVIRDLVAAGHEVAMHGYDHVYWQDRLPHLSAADIAAELGRAHAAFEEILGRAPQAFGAPGWQCTAASLAGEDRLGLVYHSDTRGFAPFMPRMASQRFTTLEIPTTLPTLDEAYGRIGTTPHEVARFYHDALRPGFNVYTAHAEMEGIAQLPHLRAFLEGLRPSTRVRRLFDIAATVQDAPVAEVGPGPIAGRAGTVAWQAVPHV